MATADVSAPGFAAGETGIPLLRADAAAEAHRASTMRTAAIGRYILFGLGAVTLGSGAGLAFAREPSTALVFLLVGALLVALGLVQHRIYRRSRAEWPAQLLLFPDGIELVLTSGEIRAVDWSDPKLDFTVHVRHPGDPSATEYLFAWGGPGRVPPCSITAEGFERLKSEVVARSLSFRDERTGHGAREVRLCTVGPAPKKVVHSAAEWGP